VTKDTVEKKSFNLEIKAVLPVESTDGKWIVEGYASTFDLDSGGDKIMPGAFKETIKKRFEEPMAINGKSKVKVLWQHDQEILIGKLLELVEDEKGLYVKLELFNDPSFPEAERAYKLCKMGEIFCFSIGYKVTDSDYMELEDGSYVRLLKNIVLFEVSLVTFPMNEKAEVTNVKERNNLMSEQAVELLKEIKSLLQQIKEDAVFVKSEPVVVEIKSEEIAVEAESEVKELEEEKNSDLEEPHAPEFVGQEVEGMDCDEKGKCPKCGSEMKQEEVSSEQIEAVVEEVVQPKYLTLEEVKAVIEEIMVKNTKVEEISEKEEKSSNDLEDFVNFLLNTEISFLKNS